MNEWNVNTATVWGSSISRQQNSHWWSLRRSPQMRLRPLLRSPRRHRCSIVMCGAFEKSTSTWQLITYSVIEVVTKSVWDSIDGSEQPVGRKLSHGCFSTSCTEIPIWSSSGEGRALIPSAQTRINMYRSCFRAGRKEWERFEEGSWRYTLQKSVVLARYSSFPCERSVLVRS